MDPDVLETIAYVQATLADGEASAAAAASEVAAAVRQQLADGQSEPHLHLATAIGATHSAIDSAIDSIAGRTAAVVRDAGKILRGAEDELTQVGVQVPYSHFARVADLAAGNPDVFLARVPQFAAAMPDFDPATLPEFQEQGTPKAPDIPPPDDTPVIDPVVPPPVVPPTVPPGQPGGPFPIPPTGCPPGHTSRQYSWGEMMPNGRACDSLLGCVWCFPTVPPTVPPPPPSGPMPPGLCRPGVAPVKGACGVIRRPAKPVPYWIVTECIDECTFSWCCYSGDIPPLTGPNQNVYGPWYGSCGQITAWFSDGAQCVGGIVQPPTTPPPPSPPGSPPNPPPPPPPPGVPPPAVPPPPPGVPPPAVPPPPPSSDPKPSPGDHWHTEPLPPAASAGVDWSKPFACPTAERFVANPAAQIIELTPGEAAGSSGSVFQTVWDGVKWFFTSPPEIKNVLDGVDPNDPVNVDLKTKGVENNLITDALELVLGRIGPQAVPNRGAALTLGTRLALANKAEANTGFPTSYLYHSDLLTFQYANPQFIPTQGELNVLYSQNRISDEAWTCFTRANGNIPQLAAFVRDAGQVRPIVSDVVSLYNRGYFSTDREYTDRMRTLGVTDPLHAMEFQRLSMQPPGVADLIRYMTRDAADEQVVQQYQYDKDFTEKVTPQIESWAKAQGVPLDVLKYSWRSHWEIPSNTQLYEMLHRLRRDRPEVHDWEAASGLRAVPIDRLPNPGQPLVVDPVTVYRALEINDHAPTWIDSLMRISYHPLTRTDAVRAFQIGSLTEEQLGHSIRDNGYSPSDTDLLLGFYRQVKSQTLASQAGTLSIKQVVKGYSEGYIDRWSADGHLTSYIGEPQQRTKILDDADRMVAYKTREEVIKGQHRRYLYGELDDDTARQNLMLAGVEAGKAGSLVDAWFVERAGRSKEPRVAMLCQWYTHGFLTEGEYYERLLRLGYTAEDAGRIAGVCAADYSAKKAADAARAAEKARKEAAQRGRENLKALEEQEKKLRQQIKDAEQRLRGLQRQLPAGSGQPAAGEGG